MILMETFPLGELEEDKLGVIELDSLKVEDDEIESVHEDEGLKDAVKPGELDRRTENERVGDVDTVEQVVGETETLDVGELDEQVLSDAEEVLLTLVDTQAEGDLDTEFERVPERVIEGDLVMLGERDIVGDMVDDEAKLGLGLPHPEGEGEPLKDILGLLVRLVHTVVDAVDVDESDAVTLGEDELDEQELSDAEEVLLTLEDTQAEGDLDTECERVPERVTEGDHVMLGERDIVGDMIGVDDTLELGLPDLDGEGVPLREMLGLLLILVHTVEDAENLDESDAVALGEDELDEQVLTDAEEVLVELVDAQAERDLGTDPVRVTERVTVGDLVMLGDRVIVEDTVDDDDRLILGLLDLDGEGVPLREILGLLLKLVDTVEVKEREDEADAQALELVDKAYIVEFVTE